MTTNLTTLDEHITAMRLANDLARCVNTVPVHWIQQCRRPTEIREAFHACHLMLTPPPGGHWPAVDASLRADVARIAAGTDPRGGPFKDQAVAVASQLAHALAEATMTAYRTMKDR